MPLSSPARLAECTIEDAAEAMSGNLMFCSGNAVEDYVRPQDVLASPLPGCAGYVCSDIRVVLRSSLCAFK